MSSNSTEVRKVRRFGATALLFFGALCALAVWRDKAFGQAFFGVLAALGLAFFLLPGPLRPAYERYLRFAHAVGQVLTLVMLTLAFYLVITPFGLAKKLFGGSPLPLHPSRKAATYWVARQEPAQPKDRFARRY